MITLYNWIIHLIIQPAADNICCFFSKTVISLDNWMSLFCLRAIYSRILCNSELLDVFPTNTRDNAPDISAMSVRYSTWKNSRITKRIFVKFNTEKVH
jgi:hypothetical protein